MHYASISWVILSSFIVAVYYTLKLARETKYERYWVFFFISAVFMGVHHIAVIPSHYGLIDDAALSTITNVGELVGTLALAYAAYGISKSMKKIRQRFPKE